VRDENGLRRCTPLRVLPPAVFDVLGAAPALHSRHSLDPLLAPRRDRATQGRHLPRVETRGVGHHAKHPIAANAIGLPMTISSGYELSICSDCASAIANNDTSALDNNPATADQRRDDIAIGLSRWATRGSYLVAGDRIGEFETTPCDTCGLHDAGARHHAASLTDTSTETAHS
jgi:hypothetical protein